MSRDEVIEQQLRHELEEHFQPPPESRKANRSDYYHRCSMAFEGYDV